MRIGIALAGSLLAIAVAIGLTLARSPQVVVARNMLVPHKTLTATDTDAEACQAGEVLPRSTAAIRLGLTTNIGSRVRVTVMSGIHTIDSGSQAPGWRGASVTVPLRPLRQTYAPVRVCFALSDLNASVGMLGLETDRREAARSHGRALPGRVRIEYLRSGERSWWSMIDEVAWRLGLGRAASGTWNALLLVALTLTLVALSSWLVTRELR